MTGHWSTESSEKSTSSDGIVLDGLVVGRFVGRVGNSSIVKSIVGLGVSVVGWVVVVVGVSTSELVVSLG